MTAPSKAETRAAIFGDSRYKDAWIVQLWVKGHTPQLWRQTVCRTEAGVKRCLQGTKLSQGVREPHRIVVLRITEKGSFDVPRGWRL